MRLIDGMRRARGMEVGSCTEAWIEKTALGQKVKSLQIQVGAFALVDDRPVPGKAQPFEVLQDEVRVSGARTSRIYILDTQQDLSAFAAGDKPGHERCEHVPRVHPSGGRGCDTGYRPARARFGRRLRKRSLSWSHIHTAILSQAPIADGGCAAGGYTVRGIAVPDVHVLESQRRYNREEGRRCQRIRRCQMANCSL